MAAEIRRIRLLQLPAAEGEGLGEDLSALVARRLEIDRQDVLAAQLVKRSLDARHRRPRWVLTVDAEIRGAANVLARIDRDRGVRGLPAGEAAGALEAPVARIGLQPIVVGAGPAGLFAALALARKGYRPLLVERGKDVRRRWKDVRAYWSHATLDPESNVAFGEGGAGTFSDGKVYTRRNDPRNPFILETLARAAQAPDILTAARPHLGTNRLSRALLALRPELEAQGVEFRFEARLTGIEVRDGRVVAVDVSGERLETDALFLATGHGARDVHEALLAASVPIEARPFAVGARIEHPQELIDACQYGDAARAEELGAASYMLTYSDRRTGRSAHTFCTCPGGEVVAAATEPDGVVVNGMSYSHRGQPFCNSAVVVEVQPEECGGEGPLAGVAFQRDMEKRAAEEGGGDQVAPAQRVLDFLAGRPSKGTWATSYRLGVKGTDLGLVLPESVVATMRRALRHFGRRIPGFDVEGHLIGVESRTSSPIRVVRDPVTFQSVSVAGLFPIGEGAGYAGGIVSAASDGLRAVERVAAREGSIVEAS